MNRFALLPSPVRACLANQHGVGKDIDSIVMKDNNVVNMIKSSTKSSDQTAAPYRLNKVRIVELQ